jgi:hypothetical protein
VIVRGAPSPRWLLGSCLSGFVVATGCSAPATTAAGPGASSLSLPTPTERRAPGIALDPLFELPKAVPSGSAESGVVVLAEPADTRPALRTVEAFFAAVISEGIDDLERVLERSAETRSSPKSRRDPALDVWRRRFERLDYTSLASEVLYRPSDVELHTAGDAQSLGRGRSLPVLPHGQELLVRVPMIGGATAKFFGSEIVFLLRPGPGGYKIGEIFEDFRLP